MKASSLPSTVPPFPCRRPARWFLAVAAVAGILGLFATPATQADDRTNAPAAPTAAAAPAAPAPKKKISGVELYAIHCNRCHPERYPVELNEAQWKTIMLHMRVRANLPAAQAREVMKYLQEEAGN
jgi:hypothetical protein